MTEPGWIEIACEREMTVAQDKAKAKLEAEGLRVDDLSPEVLRIDVGLDAEHQTYYRVRVHESVVGSK